MELVSRGLFFLIPEKHNDNRSTPCKHAANSTSLINAAAITGKARARQARKGKRKISNRATYKHADVFFFFFISSGSFFGLSLQESLTGGVEVYKVAWV